MWTTWAPPTPSQNLRIHARLLLTSLRSATDGHIMKWQSKLLFTRYRVLAVTPATDSSPPLYIIHLQWVLPLGVRSKQDQDRNKLSPLPRPPWAGGGHMNTGLELERPQKPFKMTHCMTDTWVPRTELRTSMPLPFLFLRQSCEVGAIVI